MNKKPYNRHRIHLFRDAIAGNGATRAEKADLIKQMEISATRANVLATLAERAGVDASVIDRVFRSNDLHELIGLMDGAINGGNQ